MPFLRSWFRLSKAWRTAFAAAGLLTLAAFVEAGETRGSRAARGRNVAVWRTPIELAGQPEVLYIKCYHYDGQSMRYWARCSRAWREARNYRILADLGIPGPETMAVGEQRHAFGLHRALVLTREVEDACNLEDVVETAEFAADAALRQRILEQAAAFAGRAHRRSFFHRDLKLRSLLVQGFPSPRCRLLWIDCPLGGYYWLGRWHLAAADLEDMGKRLRPAVTAKEWDAFMRQYASARHATTP